MKSRASKFPWRSMSKKNKRGFPFRVSPWKTARTKQYNKNTIVYGLDESRTNWQLAKSTAWRGIEVRQCYCSICPQEGERGGGGLEDRGMERWTSGHDWHHEMKQRPEGKEKKGGTGKVFDKRAVGSGQWAVKWAERENDGEADRKRSEHAPAKVCPSYIWLQRVLTLFCHSPSLLLSPSNLISFTETAPTNWP